MLAWYSRDRSSLRFWISWSRVIVSAMCRPLLESRCGDLCKSIAGTAAVWGVEWPRWSRGRSRDRRVDRDLHGAAERVRNGAAAFRLARDLGELGAIEAFQTLGDHLQVRRHDLDAGVTLVGRDRGGDARAAGFRVLA